VTAGANDAAAALLGMLARHTGFALSGDRGLRARAAILDAMTRRGIDAAAYLQLVAGDPIAFDSLVGEVLVGETYFQREPQQWALLRETILPDVARRRSRSHVIRCWSAGCASGEEAYSLAIALTEAGLADRARVVGTDISAAGLARARAATYGTWSLRAASPAFIDRWLTRSGDRHVVVDEIRGRVEFASLNLVADDYPSPGSGIGPQDVILCRNVLLYFDRETTLRVVQKLHRALAPGGWLVCGSSDPSPAPYAPFRAVHTRDGIAYQRSLGAEAVVPPAPVEVPVAVVAAAHGRPAEAEARAKADVAVRRGGSLDRAARGARRRTATRTAVRARAAREAAAAAERSSLDPALHYLEAMVLVERGRLADAQAALRRAIYLDRELAVAHFALGAVLERLGEPSRAARSYRNAAAIAGHKPADEPAPLAEGESHRAIAAAARARAEQLTAGARRGSR
jgi:chemotaxis protein methyltransferase CheR